MESGCSGAPLRSFLRGAGHNRKTESGAEQKARGCWQDSDSMRDTPQRGRFGPGGHFRDLRSPETKSAICVILRGEGSRLLRPWFLERPVPRVRCVLYFRSLLPDDNRRCKISSSRASLPWTPSQRPALPEGSPPSVTLIKAESGHGRLTPTATVCDPVTEPVAVQEQC
jgi:hypothetical protein